MGASPMKPQSAERLPGEPGWVFEPKYDGYRAAITVQGAAARLVSRRGTDLTPCSLSWRPQPWTRCLTAPNSMLKW